MRCENKQGDIVAGKLYRVVGLLSYLVTEAKVIDQRLIEQVVDNICSGK